MTSDTFHGRVSFGPGFQRKLQLQRSTSAKVVSSELMPHKPPGKLLHHSKSRALTEVSIVTPARFAHACAWDGQIFNVKDSGYRCANSPRCASNDERSINRIPRCAYLFLMTADLTGGRKSFAAHGAQSSNRVVRESPVCAHRSDLGGSRIHVGPLTSLLFLSWRGSFFTKQHQPAIEPEDTNT